jgi:predicted metallo-beta-lactamase superfamily hydrolase
MVWGRNNYRHYYIGKKLNLAHSQNLINKSASRIACNFTNNLGKDDSHWGSNTQEKLNKR